MYSYTFDSKTGGILLNSTPTNFSKEPRPVYAAEMDISRTTCRICGRSRIFTGIEECR